MNDEPEHEPEFFTLPPTSDRDYWDKNVAAGLHQPGPLNGQPLEETDDDDLDSWHPINLADLAEQPPLQPTLGLGIAYPGKRHVFSGPQESAKTLAAYALGLVVIRDGKRIVIIDFEMGAYDARDRLRDLGATNTELAQILYVDPSEPATPERIAGLAERRPALVIVDAAAGAYDLQGLDDNKRSDVERFTRVYVKQFWKAGIATVVLDHVVKNADDRGKYAIGSERKVGGADVHLGFEVITPIKRGSAGLYKIVTHKDRGGWLKRGTLANLELDSDPDTHQIGWKLTQPEPVDDEHPFRPTRLMEKVSRHLGQQEHPVSKNSVCEVLGGRRQYVLTAIDILCVEGFATADQEGIHHVRHYLENEDQTQVVPGGSQVVPGTGSVGGGSGGSPGSPPYGWDGNHRSPRAASGTEETDKVVPDDGGTDIPF